jgi:hypothetical protein
VAVVQPFVEVVGMLLAFRKVSELSEQIAAEPEMAEKMVKEKDLVA